MFDMKFPENAWELNSRITWVVLGSIPKVASSRFLVNNFCTYCLNFKWNPSALDSCYVLIDFCQKVAKKMSKFYQKLSYTCFQCYMLRQHLLTIFQHALFWHAILTTERPFNCEAGNFFGYQRNRWQMNNIYWPQNEWRRLWTFYASLFTG